MIIFWNVSAVPIGRNFPPNWKNCSNLNWPLPQKTWEIQKNAEREVKEILVEVGSEVEVGTALFIYDTESLEADLQQAQLDLERADTDMETCAVRSHNWKKKRNPLLRMTSFPIQPKSRQRRWI